MADIDKIGQDILNKPKGGTMEAPASLEPITREGTVREAVGAVGDFLTGQSYEREDTPWKATINRGGRNIGDFFFGGGEFFQAVSEKRQPTGGQALEAALEAAGPVGKVAAVGGTVGGWLWKQMSRTGKIPVTPFSKQGGFLGGEKAARALPPEHPARKAMDEAKRMKEAGVYSNKEIASKTGIEVGLDGQLRFEVSDKNMKWVQEPKKILKKGATSDKMPIMGLIDHPTLFATYPGLKDYKIKFKPMGKTKGAHYGNRREIHLNSDLLDGSQAQLSTALHELQHGIQSIEGFVGGADPADILDSLKMILPEGEEVSEEVLAKTARHLYALKHGEMEARLVQNRFLHEVGAPVDITKGKIVDQQRHRQLAGQRESSIAERVDYDPQYSWGSVEEFKEQAPKVLEKLKSQSQ